MDMRQMLDEVREKAELAEKRLLECRNVHEKTLADALRKHVEERERLVRKRWRKSNYLGMSTNYSSTFEAFV